MKNVFIVAFMFSLFLFCIDGQGQTIYGVSGFIKTPNAYIVEDGSCTIGMACFDDYHGFRDILYKQGTVNVNIGFHSRFELGARLAIIPDVPGDSPIYDVCFDRILSGKFVLIEEKDNYPQLALGLQDFIGTRLHNSTYLVATKNFRTKGSFNFLVNLGYGTKLNDYILGDAKAHHFQGFFGGTEIGIKNIVYFIAEYDAKDVNAGIQANIKDWLNLNFALMRMKNMSAGISLRFTL